MGNSDTKHVTASYNFFYKLFNIISSQLDRYASIYIFKTLIQPALQYFFCRFDLKV